MGATVTITGGVSAAVSYKIPAVSASYRQISVAAKLTFPTRFLVEVITPADVLVRSVGKVTKDTALLADAPSKNLTKARTDTVSVADDPNISFALDKILREVQALSDKKVVALAKALVELAVASDAKSITLSRALADSNLTLDDLARVTPNKGIKDSVAMADSIEAVRLFAREFIETLVTTELKQLSLTKAPFNDAAAASDLNLNTWGKTFHEAVVMIDNMDGDITYQIVKVIGELISMSEQLSRSTGLAKSESLTISTSGVAFITDYADISYFAEDYVGVSSTFS